LAALFELAQLLADLLQHRPFLETAPSRYQSEGGHPIGFGFRRGLQDWFRRDEIVAWRFGGVGGGLGTKAAVLRASPRLDIYDRAEMDLVALKLLANAVGPGEQLMDIRCVAQMEDPLAFRSGEAAARQHSLGKAGQAR